MLAIILKSFSDGSAGLFFFFSCSARLPVQFPCKAMDRGKDSTCSTSQSLSRDPGEGGRGGRGREEYAAMLSPPSLFKYEMRVP